MGFISHIQYDNHGNAVPIPLATTVSNHINKFVNFPNSRRWHCNGDPYRLRPYTVSPENDVLPPGTPLQRSPQLLPRLDSVWNTGGHRTHLLDSNGDLVEYRAPFQTQLTQLLSEKGFPEQTTVLLTERSAIRKADDHWKAPKISVSAINRVHALFADEALSLEDYINQLTALLDPEGRADVYGFLESIAESLESNTYSTRAKFGSKLKEAFLTFRDDGNAVAEDEEDAEDDEAAPAATEAAPEGKADYEKLKSRDIKTLVKNAYGGFVEGKVSQPEFLTVTRKYAFRRVSWKFKGCDQYGQTEDDITQIAMVKMWDALPTFKDTSEGFFVWFRHLINNTVKDAKRGSLKESKRHAPLFVVNEDGDEEDNPGIYGSIQFKRNGNVTYQESLESRRALPEFIQGKVSANLWVHR